MKALFARDPRTGFFWLYFASKPDDTIRARLHAAEWKWNRPSQGWYYTRHACKIPEGIEYTEIAYDQVLHMTQETSHKDSQV